MAGNINYREKGMFRDLHYFSATRGMHSSGLAYVIHNDETTVVKSLGPPTDLWKGLKFSTTGIVSATPKVLIGHNRSATSGTITVENAHPFEVDHIVGVHNGTLRTLYALNGKQGEVDSFRLYQTVVEKGIKETWESLYDDDAAALVFWDKNEKTVNIIRNNERTLFYAYSESKDCIFWASEAWMIRTAASRNGVKLAVDPEGIAIQAFPVNVLHVLKPTMSKVECEVGLPFVQKKPIPVVYKGYGSTTGGNNTYVPTYTSPKRGRGKDRKLNFGWANGLHKSDKLLRGKLYKLDHLRYANQGSVSYAVAYRVGGDESVPYHLCIYPQKESELEILRAQTAPNVKTVVRLTARPRLFTDPALGQVAKIDFVHAMPVVKGADVIPFPQSNPDVLDLDTLFSKDVPKTETAIIPTGNNMAFLERIKNRMYEFVDDFAEQMVFNQRGCACAVCSNTMDYARDQFYWFDKGNTLVCDDCIGSELVMEQFGT